MTFGFHILLKTKVLARFGLQVAEQRFWCVWVHGHESGPFLREPDETARAGCVRLHFVNQLWNTNFCAPHQKSVEYKASLHPVCTDLRNEGPVEFVHKSLLEDSTLSNRSFLGILFGNERLFNRTNCPPDVSKAQTTVLEFKRCLRFSTGIFLQQKGLNFVFYFGLAVWSFGKGWKVLLVLHSPEVVGSGPVLVCCPL